MFASWGDGKRGRFTGRLVVPDVYSIIPADPGPIFSRVTFSWMPPPWNLANRRYAGSASSSVLSTSSALEANLAEDSSIKASLWFKTYCSSNAGNAGDSGTAMDLAARMARRVTFGR